MSTLSATYQLGNAECWGWNLPHKGGVSYYGPTWLGNEGDEFATNRSYVTTAGGGHTICLWNGTGSIVWCAGQNFQKQLGQPDAYGISFSEQPLRVVGMKDMVKQVMVHSAGVCTVTHQNKVYCWGTLIDEHTGSASQRRTSTPTAVPAPMN